MCTLPFSPQKNKQTLNEYTQCSHSLINRQFDYQPLLFYFVPVRCMSTANLLSHSSSTALNVPRSSVFVCNRCQSGMEIDPTLEGIDESVLSGLGGEGFSTQSAVLTALLELASDSSQIDHPLCVECSQLLVFELHKQVADLDMENERYTQYYSQLDQSGDVNEEDLEIKIEQVG